MLIVLRQYHTSIVQTQQVKKIAIQQKPSSAMSQGLAYPNVKIKFLYIFIASPLCSQSVFEVSFLKLFAGKKCDGIVHCIEGEDEALETCRYLYPEEATIECNDRPKGHYDIRVMAIPCNGIPECLNDMDENCDENIIILFGVILALVIITNIIYHYLKWQCLDWTHQNIQTSGILDDDWILVDCSNIMGDELANMKVIIYYRNQCKKYRLLTYLFMFIELNNPSSMCRITAKSWIL